MNFTNYWNQDSGDSQASNWNQANWASGSSGPGSSFMDNLNNTNSSVGRWQNGSWVDPVSETDATMKIGGTGSDNPLKPGGKPQVGTGSNPAMTTADGGSAVSTWGGPQNQANFDWQMYAEQNPDVLAANYGAGLYTNPWDQMWAHWNHANSIGDNRAYVGYANGRTDPRYAPVSTPQPAATPPPTNPWISSPARGGGGSSNGFMSALL